MRLEDIDETGEAIDARARIMARARSFLAPDGKPCEQDPDTFYRVAAPTFATGKHDHDTSWCGIFCLAVYKLEGFAQDIAWKIGERGADGNRRYGYVYNLPTVSLPLPGDTVVFRKGADGRDLWHHALVDDVRNGRVYTIDGNVLPFPKEGCAAKDRAIDSNATFYSIAVWLR